MDGVAARWDAKAETWDRELLDPACHLNEDGAYDRFLEALAAIVRSRREFCSNHGAIDLGCATGLVLARAIEHFAWGVGIDISPRMIALAKRKQLPRARFVVGDIFRLSAAEAKAGAVLSRGILLSHYRREDAATLLRNAGACLVPGGFLLWDFLNQAGQGKYLHRPVNKTYFEYEEVRTLAQSAGFGDEQVLGRPDSRVGILYARRRE
jgi:SAM-dependent methyltransferase